MYRSFDFSFIFSNSCTRNASDVDGGGARAVQRLLPRDEVVDAARVRLLPGNVGIDATRAAEVELE
jgi:hypothetical protein